MKHSVLLSLLLVSSCAAAPSIEPGPWPPPAGPLRVIIDTDAANEIDDQYALALALGFPERIRIEGLVAAHLGEKQGASGIQKSYDEILEVLRRSPRTPKLPVHRGNLPLKDGAPAAASEGVRFIIERARAGTPDEPLWLVVLGPVTDAVAALREAPDIADRMIVFWHGRSEWPRYCRNFNAKNDPRAARLIFDLPSRYVLFDTGAQILIPLEEARTRLGPLGPLGAYLHEIRSRHAWALSPKKGIFDLGDIAVLIDPACGRWEQAPAPRVQEDLAYDFSQSRGRLLRIYDVDPARSIDLLEEALRKLRP